jgi:outer membrane cobalamin receptor
MLETAALVIMIGSLLIALHQAITVFLVVFPGNVGNLDLSWEVNKPLNIGLDVSVLKSRLNVSMDWYNRKSEGTFIKCSVVSNFRVSLHKHRMLAKWRTKGVEVTIVATPVRSKDFNWTVNFNFAYNKNKVLALPDHNPDHWYVHY